jgi:hypothetical protein
MPVEKLLPFQLFDPSRKSRFRSIYFIGKSIISGTGTSSSADTVDDGGGADAEEEDDGGGG